MHWISGTGYAVNKAHRMWIMNVLVLKMSLNVLNVLPPLTQIRIGMSKGFMSISLSAGTNVFATEFLAIHG